MAFKNNQPVKAQQNPVAAQNIANLEAWIGSANVKKKFNDVLDKGSGAFVTALLSLVKATPQLQQCDPKTILSAAMTAATMKLPINPNLGFAYIVPYKTEASFQIGYKGIIQLAMRTGQYKTINASVVREGEIEGIDFITGEIIRGKRVSDNIIGYIAYFKLVNGFEKTLYMTREEVEAHAIQYSQAYNADKRYGKSRSVWTSNFDAMALKTVLKRLISKYGIMSIDMQGADNMAKAIESDGAVIREDGTPDYVDAQDVASEEPQDFDRALAEGDPKDLPMEERLEREAGQERLPDMGEPQSAPVESPGEGGEAPALDFAPGEPDF